MSEILVSDGTVLTPSGPAEVDLRIDGGRVVEVGSDLDPRDARVVDAGGCWVGPGFVDMHAHLREPGDEYKEDIASGSTAAAAGGYTAVVAMPNTTPPIDAGHLARFIIERGRSAGAVDVVPAGCISEGRAGLKLAHLDELWDAGVRVFTDDGDTVADAGLLRRAMEYVAELGGVVAQHAVDRGLAAGGHMHEGTVSARLGIQGIPRLAEETVLARDLALVRLTGVRYHAQHLSTAGAFDMIAAAKAEGLRVTAEVTPHHMTFDHTEVAAGDPMFKMMPPLRSADDVAAAKAALRSGVADVVATDHAPHAAHEKEVTFEEAPFGVIGLEWSAAVTNTAAHLHMERFFERLSVAPAHIVGLDASHGRPVKAGRIANLVVFDPEATFTAATTLSRSVNSPYLGREWKGVVRATIRQGQLTFSSEGAVV